MIKTFDKFHWTPSADFANFYSYENLKQYDENNREGKKRRYVGY